jgi:hypothetical protein
MPPPDHADAKINRLDAVLLDVMAQVEAVLRCSREIQRRVLRLRGGDGAISTAARRRMIHDVRAAAAEIEHHYSGGSEIVADLRSAAHDLE